MRSRKASFICKKKGPGAPSLRRQLGHDLVFKDSWFVNTVKHDSASCDLLGEARAGAGDADKLLDIRQLLEKPCPLRPAHI